MEENALPPAPESLLLLKANMSFLCEECKIWASVGCRKREIKVPVDDESSGLGGGERCSAVQPFRLLLE